MWIPAICRPKNVVHNSLEREKSGSLLFGAQKCISQHFGARKKRMTAISSQKTRFTAIRSKKKLVYSNFELEKLSQLFGKTKT